MIKKHLPVFIFIFCVLVLYISNLSRSVYGGDVGDLVTSASVMGVAHPPGYPLFTFVGFLLTRFAFLGFTQAFLVGLISAFSAAGGLLLFYFLSFYLSKNRLASLIATAILAFSFLYWFYAEIAEVFALNGFFAIILFLFAFLYHKFSSKFMLFLFSLFLGLSITNHQTIVFIYPSLFMLIASPFLHSFKKSKKTLLLFIMGLLLGISPYLYIPYAASHHPIINWDNVHDIPSFLHLILRLDYGTFQAGVFEAPTLLQRLVTLKVYFLSVIPQLTILVVAVSLLGLYVLWKKEKTLVVSLIIAFILSGPLFVAYAGFPLTGSFIFGVYERFFLLSSIILLMPFAVGLTWLSTGLSNIFSRKLYSILFQLVFLIVPLSLFFYNFPKTNLSHLMIGDTYAQDLIASMPHNALLVFTGDTLVFNTWYVHYVRHIRDDVTIYNFGGKIQNENWGIPQNLESEKGAKNNVEKIIADLGYQAKFRPVFSTLLLQPTKGEKVIWMPYGLTYQYIPSQSLLPSKDKYLQQQQSLWNSFHIPSAEEKKQKAFHNLTVADFSTGFSNAALAVGTFIYTQYADSQDALVYYKKAEELDPTNAKVYEILGTYYMGTEGKCVDVVKNFTTAINLDPFDKLSYFLLYKTSKDCFHTNDIANKIVKQFEFVFQQDFFKELKKAQSQ